MSNKKICVIGAGTMGRGIAQVCAMSGYQVGFHDISDQALEEAIKNIEKSLNKFAYKSKIDESEVEEILLRIKITSDLKEAAGDADIVIESAVEILEVKQKIFKNLDEICKLEAILATNTSGIPIAAVSEVVNRKDKVIGLHFMNPVPLMRGVEVIPSKITSKETIEQSVKFLNKIGKEEIFAVDYAGFISTRLICAFLNEAAKCVQDGNNPEDVDKVMKLCFNHPMGPCQLMDLIGLDVMDNGLKILENDFGERFKVAPIVKQMNRSGLKGAKTKQGWYRY